jgi:hypothetical protein
VGPVASGEFDEGGSPGWRALRIRRPIRSLLRVRVRVRVRRCSVRPPSLSARTTGRGAPGGRVDGSPGGSWRNKSAFDGSSRHHRRKKRTRAEPSRPGSTVGVATMGTDATRASRRDGAGAIAGREVLVRRIPPPPKDRPPRKDPPPRSADDRRGTHEGVLPHPAQPGTGRRDMGKSTRRNNVVAGRDELMRKTPPPLRDRPPRKGPPPRSAGDRHGTMRACYRIVRGQVPVAMEQRVSHQSCGRTAAGRDRAKVSTPHAWGSTGRPVRSDLPARACRRRAFVLPRTGGRRGGSPVAPRGVTDVSQFLVDDPRRRLRLPRPAFVAAGG